jgi:flagellar biosynthetic protein FliQ
MRAALAAYGIHTTLAARVCAMSSCAHRARTSLAQFPAILNSMEAFDSLLRNTIVVCAVTALPILLAATLVGLAIAIVQAATQIQEQTLPLLPKILGVGLVLIVFGHFGYGLLGALFDQAISSVPQIVRAQP